MKVFAALSLAIALVSANPTPAKRAPNVQGLDVTSLQVVNWARLAANGAKFAYVQATDGTTFVNPLFTQQYSGATNAGLIRGAFHVASPALSSGAAQARQFLARGGRWSPDGRTLPGALEIQDNPVSSVLRCYGLSPAQMVNWVREFSDTYQASTGRYPVILTNTAWWNACTGNSAAFGSTNPLWISRFASTIGPLPAGWRATFWKYDSGGIGPGDQDYFLGDEAGLKRFAQG